MGALKDPESLLARLQEQHLMVGQGKSSKRQGVSGESGGDDSSAPVQHYNKDFRLVQYHFNKRLVTGFCCRDVLYFG